MDKEIKKGCTIEPHHIFVCPSCGNNIDCTKFAENAIKIMKIKEILND